MKEQKSGAVPVVQDLLDILEEMAPQDLAESWDNPGLLVGSPQAEIHGIFTCLDVSCRGIEAARKKGADVIVSHHPLIFHPMKKIRTDEAAGACLSLLLRYGISVIAAHTNLDMARGGVNDVLAEAIGLQQIGSFVPMGEASMGRMGCLPSAMTAEAFARQVKASLPVSHVRLVVPEGEARLVKRVALCSGAGAEFIPQAAAMGADAYVTGDVRYHEAQQAAEAGLVLVDAGHFGTEFLVAASLQRRLTQAFQSRGVPLAVFSDTQARDFFQVI